MTALKSLSLPSESVVSLPPIAIEINNECYLNLLTSDLLAPNFKTQFMDLKKQFLNWFSLNPNIDERHFLLNNNNPSALVILSLAETTNTSILDILTKANIEIIVHSVQEKINSIIIRFAGNCKLESLQFTYPSKLLEKPSKLFSNIDYFFERLNLSDYVEEEYLLNNIPDEWKEDDLFKNKITEYYLSRKPHLFFKNIYENLKLVNQVMEYEDNSILIIRDDKKAIFLNSKNEPIPPIFWDFNNLGTAKKVYTNKNISKFAQVFLLKNPNADCVLKPLQNEISEDSVTTPNKEMAITYFTKKERVIHVDIRAMDFIKKNASHILAAAKGNNFKEAKNRLY